MTSRIVNLKAQDNDAARATAARSRLWAIDAPWAHPLWSQYGALVYPLTSGMTRFQSGMTHECMLWAIDPAHRFDMESEDGTALLNHRLTPANMGYQFPAETDEQAFARMQGLVDLIDARTLSPDTDFRSTLWDPLFTDGHSLVRSAFAPTKEPYEEIVP